MPPIWLCWPTTWKANVGSRNWTLSPINATLNYVVVQHMAAERQSDKTVSDMKVLLKHSIKFAIKKKKIQDTALSG